MLATLVKTPFSDKGWIFERKFDGIRCLAVKKGDKVLLYSRNQKRIDSRYPELRAVFEEQKEKNFIVDGEIVASSFSELQKRIHLKRKKSDVSVVFYAFDLLSLNNKDQRKLPQIERKKKLKSALTFKGKLRYSSHVKGKGIEAFQKASANDWEGIIAKKSDAPYLSGRHRYWLKFKCGKKGRFVICGYTDPKGARKGFGALLIGYYKNKTLRYAGRVGTGYDSTLLKSLSARLKKIEIQKAPFKRTKIPLKGVHYVRATIKCQIGFSEWTKDKRLRHPRFIKLLR